MQAGGRSPHRRAPAEHAAGGMPACAPAAYRGRRRCARGPAGRWPAFRPKGSRRERSRRPGLPQSAAPAAATRRGRRCGRWYRPRRGSSPRPGTALWIYRRSRGRFDLDLPRPPPGTRSPGRSFVIVETGPRRSDGTRPGPRGRPPALVSPLAFDPKSNHSREVTQLSVPFHLQRTGAGAAISLLPVAAQGERRPVHRVRGGAAAVQEVALGLLERAVLRLPGAQAGVETLPQPRRDAVGDRPERSQDGARPGVLEGAGEADQSFAARVAPEAGLA